MFSLISLTLYKSSPEHYNNDFLSVYSEYVINRTRHHQSCCYTLQWGVARNKSNRPGDKSIHKTYCMKWNISTLQFLRTTIYFFLLDLIYCSYPNILEPSETQKNLYCVLRNNAFTCSVFLFFKNISSDFSGETCSVLLLVCWSVCHGEEETLREQWPLNPKPWKAEYLERRVRGSG